MRAQGLGQTDSIGTSTQDWSQRAAGRSNCYGLLALVFRDVPTAQTVARIRSAPLARALGDCGCDVVQSLAGELEAATERLRQEYTRSFVGPGRHVSLYASVHYGDESQLWGKSTVRVKQFVERTGLSFQGHWDSIPDHIAIEFELMQRLTAHEAELWPRAASTHPAHAGSAPRLLRCLEGQADFLRDHLSVWLPRFGQRVLEAVESGFYRAMATLAGSVVAADIEYLPAATSALAAD